MTQQDLDYGFTIEDVEELMDSFEVAIDNLPHKFIEEK